MTNLHQENDNIVTLIKAVGIFLMVWGHVVSSNTITSKVIFAFHMPLFFIMSGYCFKEKYLDDAKQFVIRKIKGIYVPFILFSLPYLAMHNILCTWNVYDPEWLYGWKDFAWDTGRIVTRMSHNEGLLGTFWFLKELFWGNIIFYFTYKLSKGRLLPTVIGLFLLTELFAIFKLQIPYFTIGQRSFYAAFFISFGYLWKKLEWKVNKWWVWVLAIIGLVTELYLTNGLSMQDLSPLNLTLYAIPAILATMMVFNTCEIVEPHLQFNIKDMALFAGNHTLSIMALHFTAFKMVSLIYIKVFDLPISRLVDFPVIADFAKTWWGAIGYMIGGMVLPLCCAWIWMQMKEKILLWRQKEEK